MRGVVAGVDIGGTNTAIGLVTREGVILEETTISTKSSITFDAYIAKLVQEVSRMLGNQGNGCSLLGIGVGAPNGSMSRGGIINPPNLRWKGFLPIADEMHKHLNVKVKVINDAKAAALGELVFGAGKGMKNFIVVTLGTGLGGGVVVNGGVLMGEDEMAGELGHTSVRTDGRHCGCGKRGCLETYVSATGLSRTAVKLIVDHNRNSSLSQFTVNEINAKKVADAAQQGDKVALEAFEYTGRVFGVKLADFVAILNPEAIIVTGGLSKAGELILEPTRRHMEQNLFPIYRGKVKVLPSGLNGQNAGVIGASVLIWQDQE